MRRISILALGISAFCFLSPDVFGGPEALPSGKEMKQVAPAPAPEACNWTGFYFGVHGGGQWGHSEDRDLDFFSTPPSDKFGYDESGAVAGGQLGYNWQWKWLVLGPEVDLGYMNLEGSGVSRYDAVNYNSDLPSKTDSDFYVTFRGRIGVTHGKWLFYGTGGGIGVNYETRTDEKFTGRLHASDQELDLGWTAGGGIEYMLGCHWSLKIEYLRFGLEDQDFSGVCTAGCGSPTFRFIGIGTEGNIARAGLNYKIW